MSLNIAVLQNLPAMTVRFYRDSDFDHAYRMSWEIGPTYLGRSGGVSTPMSSPPIFCRPWLRSKAGMDL
jgi:hypothetical protein